MLSGGGRQIREQKVQGSRLVKQAGIHMDACPDTFHFDRASTWMPALIYFTLTGHPCGCPLCGERKKIFITYQTKNGVESVLLKKGQGVKNVGYFSSAGKEGREKCRESRGNPHSGMLHGNEHGLCVAKWQPFAAADAADTGRSPNPRQVRL